MDDIDHIISLRTDGPAYIDRLYRSGCSPTIVAKYEALYLDHPDIFPNSIKTYMEWILVHNSDLWKHLDSNKIKYMPVFNQQQMDWTIATRLNFYTKIVGTNQLTHHMWENTIGTILNTISVVDSDWTTSLDLLESWIVPYSLDEYNRICFKEWLVEILTRCLPKIHLSIENYDSNLPSDYYITNILGMLLTLWEQRVAPHQLAKINFSYDLKSGGSANFLTKLLFLILEAIRVGYVPALDRSQNFKDSIDLLESDITALRHRGMSTYLLRDLYTQLQYAKSIYDMDVIIVGNSALRTRLINFYTLIIDHIGGCEDIIADWSYFLLYSEGLVIKDIKMYDFILSVMEKSSNINIRTECVMIFKKHLHNPVITNKYLKTFLEKSIVVHNDVYSSTLRGNSKMLYTINLFIVIMTAPDHLLTVVTTASPDKCKKLVHVAFSDINDMNDMIDTAYNDNNTETIQPIYQHIFKKFFC